jgi:hypothetical protein
MSEAENLNFVGNYRKYDPNGRLIEYSKGSVVTYNGINYIATKNIAGNNPLFKNSGWEKITSTPTFYCQTEEPEVSSEGDRWFNPNVGLLYTRVCDNEGLHWVAT